MKNLNNIQPQHQHPQHPQMLWNGDAISYKDYSHGISIKEPNEDYSHGDSNKISIV